MNKKENFINHLLEFMGVIVTALLCFGIYRWGAGNNKACFAITLGSLAYLLLCFFNALFKNKYKGMIQKVLSGFTIIAFANEMYDYNKIIEVLPVFNNIDPMLFALIVLGSVLTILIIIKVMIFVYENADSSPASVSVDSKAQKTGNTVSDSNSSGGNSKQRQSKDNNAWMVLYFIFLTILLIGGGALFAVLYNKGVLEQSYDFFEVVTILLKYAGSIVMLLLAIVIVIILLIEMIRLIISRMKTFAASLKNERQSDTAPLYLLSIILDVVICYLTYKFTGIDMDSFYDFVNDGRYLALPLMMLFVGVAFVIFLRLTHATLVLLVDMKPENVKAFLQKVNEKTQITDRVVEIIKTIIDIVLDTLLTALEFVAFIPDFFGSLYSFVLEDEEEFTFDDDSADNQNNL